MSALTQLDDRHKDACPCDPESYRSECLHFRAKPVIRCSQVLLTFHFLNRHELIAIRLEQVSNPLPCRIVRQVIAAVQQKDMGQRRSVHTAIFLYGLQNTISIVLTTIIRNYLGQTRCNRVRLVLINTSESHA